MKHILTLSLISLLSTQATAHHSFAPHFDSERPVSLTGVVTEFEQRNPHAYLNLQVETADGRLEDWRCESHGVTQLSRNGITPEMLAEGTRIGLTGSQHRRDPHMCFFDEVFMEDGTVYNVNGPRQSQRQQQAEEPRDSIFGNWMVAPGGFATSGPQEMMDFLTETGQAAVEQYDPFVDDPTYRCEPVAIRRAWGAPGTPLSVTREDSNIVIRHEWMDIERVIHMDQSEPPVGTEPAILGYSVGHFEDDVLVIESTLFTPGVLNQFVTVEGQPMRGLLHSDGLRTVERLSFDQDKNRLIMAMDHFDPVFFTQDFPTYTREYRPSELALEPFGCIPEQLK